MAAGFYQVKPQAKACENTSSRCPGTSKKSAIDFGGQKLVSWWEWCDIMCHVSHVYASDDQGHHFRAPEKDSNSQIAVCHSAMQGDSAHSVIQWFDAACTSRTTIATSQQVYNKLHAVNTCRCSLPRCWDLVGRQLCSWKLTIFDGSGVAGARVARISVRTA